MKEQEIQNAIILLSSYTTNINFTQEYTLKNYKNNLKENVIKNPRNEKVKTRRLDLIQEFDDYIRVIELKAKTITLEDVSCVLASRNYLNLTRKKFKKQVYLYFMNPSLFGIEEEAQLLINEIPGCFYLEVETLGKAIFIEYLNSLPKEGRWKAKEIYQRFQNIIGRFDLNSIR